MLVPCERIVGRFSENVFDKLNFYFQSTMSNSPPPKKKIKRDIFQNKKYIIYFLCRVTLASCRTTSQPLLDGCRMAIRLEEAILALQFLFDFLTIDRLSKCTGDEYDARPLELL